MDDSFVCTSDYEFVPYSRQGFSGKLYLATPKKADLPKLLVKHENPCSACNEFMFSRIAEVLDIPAPRAYLFIVAAQEKSLFHSSFVVGIEYIDGLRGFDLDEVNSKKQWQTEYAAHFSLAVLCSQEDSNQMSMTQDGHIVSYDYTECFYLPSSVGAVIQNCQDDDQRATFMTNYLRSFYEGHFSIFANAGAEVVRRALGAKKKEDIYPLYHAPMKRLLSITASQLEELTDPLFEIYPGEIPIYFEMYIQKLQEKIKHYLRSVGDNHVTEEETE